MIVSKVKLLFLLLLFSVVSYGQQKFTVSGTITDSQTGETMIGVTVFPLEMRSVGATCNEYGFYSLTLPAGDYHLVCSFIGYKNDTTFISLKTNIKQDRSIS